MQMGIEAVAESVLDFLKSVPMSASTVKGTRGTRGTRPTGIRGDGSPVFLTNIQNTRGRFSCVAHKHRAKNTREPSPCVPRVFRVFLRRGTDNLMRDIAPERIPTRTQGVDI